MKTEIVEKLVANLYDKMLYTEQRQKEFKTSTKLWISVKKVHRAIKFNLKS